MVVLIAITCIAEAGFNTLVRPQLCSCLVRSARGGSLALCLVVSSQQSTACMLHVQWNTVNEPLRHTSSVRPKQLHAAGAAPTSHLTPMPKLSSYLSQSAHIQGYTQQQQQQGSSSTQAAVSRELQLLQDRHAKR